MRFFKAPKKFFSLAILSADNDRVVAYRSDIERNN